MIKDRSFATEYDVLETHILISCPAGDDNLGVYVCSYNKRHNLQRVAFQVIPVKSKQFIAKLIGQVKIEVIQSAGGFTCSKIVIIPLQCNGVSACSQVEGLVIISSSKVMCHAYIRCRCGNWCENTFIRFNSEVSCSSKVINTGSRNLFNSFCNHTIRKERFSDIGNIIYDDVASAVSKRFDTIGEISGTDKSGTES